MIAAMLVGLCSVTLAEIPKKERAKTKLDDIRVTVKEVETWGYMNLRNFAKNNGIHFDVDRKPRILTKVKAAIEERDRARSIQSPNPQVNLLRMKLPMDRPARKDTGLNRTNVRRPIERLSLEQKNRARTKKAAPIVDSQPTSPEVRPWGIRVTEKDRLTPEEVNELLSGNLRKPVPRHPVLSDDQTEESTSELPDLEAFINNKKSVRGPVLQMATKNKQPHMGIVRAVKRKCAMVDDPDEECLICFKEFHDPEMKALRLPCCSQVLCKSCLDSYLIDNGATQCLFCKHDWYNYL